MAGLYDKVIYDPESGTMISEYDMKVKTLQSRQAADSSKQSYNNLSGVADESGPIEKGVIESGQSEMSDLTQNDVPGKPSGSASDGAVGAASTMAKGGSATDAVSAGLIASGNPYAMGAGLGLQTMSTLKKQEQQQKQNKYLAEVERVKARQNAIDNLAQIGQSMKA